MLKPSQGRCSLTGTIHAMPAKKVARTLGLLPQSSIAPDGITVGDLVAQAATRTRACSASGRPRTSGSWPSRWRRPVSPNSATDTRRTLRRTAPAGLDRMALAQQTPLLLLDEPTTFPRHPAPDRRTRPLRRPPRGVGTHPGGRTARPQSRGPLRHPPHRHARRRRRRRGRAQRHRHRRTGGAGLRTALSGHRRPGDGHTADRARGPQREGEQGRVATAAAGRGGGGGAEPGREGGLLRDTGTVARSAGTAARPTGRDGDADHARRGDPGSVTTAI
ncbi:ATP-binding cassette domain-containing protein [Streptomyces tsukubensis]|uniref:hypothetical protein n=1 Tax=Streptomyces tsukubensis TaxID=83656 RepID=UPI003867E9A0